MSSVLALDQGTTGSTALVVDADGRILGRGYREFTQHFPSPGLVEHDAEEILRVTIEAAREALAGSNVRPSALGITNQRETVVAWDRKTGQPLHRALVWQDRRTAPRCRALQAKLGDQWLADRTGLVWDPYFSATKIEWLLDHVAGLKSRAASGDAVFGTIDSWLAARLTDGAAHVTDHSNASRTLLYNIRRHDWDQDLLDLFSVPRASLPEIRRSSEVVGTANARHLGVELPIASLVGDQQSALFGQGCFVPGSAKSTYGTGAFLLMNVGDTLASGDPSGVLATIACDASGRPCYALEGAIFIAGAAVQWLRDGLGLIKHASETEALAQSVADSGGVFFVPALVGLGSPWWNAEARGTIVGLTRGTSRAHLVRAALESMAYGTRDVMEAMARRSGVTLTSLKVDGGAAANDWLMQYQSDVLGVPVSRPDVVETTALGAAGLAGLATGVWKDAASFVAARHYQQFSPGNRRESEYAGWQRALRTALAWAQAGR